MNKNPKNTGREIADFFDQELPESQSNPEIAKEEIASIMKFLPNFPKSGASVLDIPCGEGHYAEVLRRDYNCNVIGIDGAKGLIDRANERYEGSEFMHGYFEDLDDLVPNNAQDAVMCINHSFGYMPTVEQNEKFLKDMYNKLKPGGSLVLQTFFNPAMVGRARKALKPGEIHDTGFMVYYDESVGYPVESEIPKDYNLPDDFRKLTVGNSRLRINEVLGELKKYANYMEIQHDGNKPVDMPIVRALAEHAGISEGRIKFHADPYDENGKLVYRCMLIIQKQ